MIILNPRDLSNNIGYAWYRNNSRPCHGHVLWKGENKHKTNQKIIECQSFHSKNQAIEFASKYSDLHWGGDKVRSSDVFGISLTIGRKAETGLFMPVSIASNIGADSEGVLYSMLDTDGNETLEFPPYICCSCTVDAGNWLVNALISWLWKLRKRLLISNEIRFGYVWQEKLLKSNSSWLYVAFKNRFQFLKLSCFKLLDLTPEIESSCCDKY